MKNFIKWLVPWDNEMKMLLKALGFFVILFIFFILTGCSTLQDKMDQMVIEQNVEQNTICCIPDPDYPKSCGGWELCEEEK